MESHFQSFAGKLSFGDAPGQDRKSSVYSKTTVEPGRGGASSLPNRVKTLGLLYFAILAFFKLTSLEVGEESPSETPKPPALETILDFRLSNVSSPSVNVFLQLAHSVCGV